MPVLDFEFWSFEFVSDFVLRILAAATGRAKPSVAGFSQYKCVKILPAPGGG